MKSCFFHQICRAARYFGCFTPVRDWSEFMTKRIHENPSIYELRLLSMIVAGSDPMIFKFHVEELGQFLQEDDISRRLDVIIPFDLSPMLLVLISRFFSRVG